MWATAYTCVSAIARIGGFLEVYVWLIIWNSNNTQTKKKSLHEDDAK